MHNDVLMIPPAERNPDDARTALAAGIVAVVLVFPIGLVLGPLAVWSGVSALRRINEADPRGHGARLAVAGLVLGAIASCFAAAMLMAEVISFALTGALIPAA